MFMPAKISLSYQSSGVGGGGADMSKIWAKSLQI